MKLKIWALDYSRHISGAPVVSSYPRARMQTVSFVTAAPLGGAVSGGSLRLPC